MGEGWHDSYWQSADGLRLHYRDYPGESDRAPILCIPGLTRNARDFADLAARLAGPRRVIVAELRGRGQSDYAPDPATYVPPTYLADILRLLDTLALPPVIVFGTSLGGIVAMLLAAVARDRLAGVLLNDIGPAIEPAGLARIRSYVGAVAGWDDWDQAAHAMAATHAIAYPTYKPADWRAMAERLCRCGADVRIVPDYDPRIALPFAAPPPDPAPDPWPLLDGLRGLPVLVVRGTLSDILSDATADEMARRLPELDRLTVAATGHAPTLDEPNVAAAVDHLLARVAGHQ